MPARASGSAERANTVSLPFSGGEPESPSALDGDDLAEGNLDGGERIGDDDAVGMHFHEWKDEYRDAKENNPERKDHGAGHSVPSAVDDLGEAEEEREGTERDGHAELAG